MSFGGEDLCDEYAKTLDENFKAKFPSFRDIYGSLSDALHAATEDEKRFELERKRIESHFLGKQAFEGAGGLKN